jgi:hypothetical protein
MREQTSKRSTPSRYFMAAVKGIDAERERRNVGATKKLPTTVEELNRMIRRSEWADDATEGRGE